MIWADLTMRKSAVYHLGSSQRKRDINPMVGQCCTRVIDSGPALTMLTDPALGKCLTLVFVG